MRYGSGGLCAFFLLGFVSVAAVFPVDAKAPLAFGKYGCVSSKYNSISGNYEYSPRGSFTVSADGSYSYLGFEKPSKGRYSVDKPAGEISFQGGYLGKGKATPISGYTNRFYLVFPGMPGGRWTCGLK